MRTEPGADAFRQNQIKNFNENKENRRFSTLISLNSHKETTETLFLNNASAVFYLVLPKCDSPYGFI